MAKAQRKDSAFLAMHDDTHVLTIVRKDDSRSHYLPGGGLIGLGTGPQFVDQLRKIFAHQLGVHHIYRDELPIYDSTYFLMSKQAGGGYVTLFERKVPTEELVSWSKKWELNNMTSSVELLTVDDIWEHLHHTERMPWGQANMAVRALLTESHSLLSERGLPLRDDIGLIKGHGVWARPE